MLTDPELLKEYRLKRLQRAAEYSLLATFHVFFILAFWGFYEFWIAGVVGIITFCMNLQLTRLREKRRSAPPSDRKRLMADTFESILFVFFIVLLSFAGGAVGWLGFTTQEYYAYLASILTGLFLGGLVGEVWYRLRTFNLLETGEQENYINNLQRSIIFPYFRRRRRNR